MRTSLRTSTRDAIIEAAFEILSQNPSAALSDITERAGVGRATLHRHFEGRDDLVRALALIALDEMDQVADAACKDAPSYAEAFRRLLAALIPLGARHGFLMSEPVEDDPEIAASIQRQMDEMSQMVDEAKQDGLFDPALPTSWIVQAFDHLLYAAWESVKSEQATAGQAADLAWRTFMNGLGKQA